MSSVLPSWLSLPFAAASWPGLLTVDFGVQLACWVVAAAFGTEKFYDLAGSSTFALLAQISYEGSSRQSWRQFVQSHMVMAWAARLGSFLFLRILKDGKDSRFDKVRDKPSKFLVYWLIQGVWVLVTLAPTLMLNKSERDPPLGFRDYLGWSLWTVGMGFECIADYQKSMFKSNPANKGQFIQNGLWSISRHPNYFGEILLWFGLYISASSTFKGLEYLSVLSPTFVYLLITRLSGIPLVEKAGLKKWGSRPEYKKYLSQTPVLVPFTNWS